MEERIIKYDPNEARQLTNMAVYRAVFKDWTDQVTEEVVYRAVHLVKQRYRDRPGITRSASTYYIAAALDCYDKSERAPPPNNVYTPESFGWDAPLLHPPHASTSTAQFQGYARSLRGVSAYTSAKILNTRRLHVQWGGFQFSPSDVIHDAIHDLESFFWVLLFLSITRAGPGRERREELTAELSSFPDERHTQVRGLRQAVHCCFDGDRTTITQNRKTLFEDNDFEEHVLGHVHPYFDAFKPMFQQWWNLLVMAYTFEGYEYYNSHAMAIRLLEEVIRNL
ncbi:hypothetical protein C8Q70DRAFT_1054025 [Cubamyces menziesii]|nr:hypothetical protein C8Q70DRAFT_1054025 [Cubamyces menziesii]